MIKRRELVFRNSPKALTFFLIIKIIYINIRLNNFWFMCNLEYLLNRQKSIVI